MKKTVLLTLMLASVALYAEVSISSTSYQEVVKVNSSGEKVKEWIPTAKVVPGTIVRYVNTLNNSGEEKATKLVVNNPIPENMEYVANSATCQSECSIRYSVDGGKTFQEPSELFVGEDQERHLAQAKEYTNIRWVLTALDAHSTSSVAYKAKLK